LVELHVGCKMDPYTNVICPIYVVVVNYNLTLSTSCMRVVSGNHHTTSKECNIQSIPTLQLTYNIDVYNHGTCMHCCYPLDLEFSTPLQLVINYHATICLLQNSNSVQLNFNYLQKYQISNLHGICKVMWHMAINICRYCNTSIIIVHYCLMSKEYKGWMRTWLFSLILSLLVSNEATKTHIM
jgi:hypothetical protein